MKGHIAAMLGTLLVLHANPSPAADPGPSQTGGPKLEVPETAFDYGYTSQNVKVAHVFWLKNSGTDTLKLKDVRPGCGCTKAPLKKKALAPGDSTDVEMTFSTGSYSMFVRKSSTIQLESPGAPPPLLDFTAYPTPKPDSLRPLTFTPMGLNLDTVKKTPSTQAWNFRVRVKNWSNHDLRIHQVSPALSRIKIETPSGAIAAGSEAALRIRIDAELADSTFSKSVTFEVSDSLHTRYTLPIGNEPPATGRPPVAH
ncbi:MAG: DUF1573 domain-containing protein [candidate division Zixibacteria bacterium]|nr:DUF1573 domain-containing protein [candidate division Zixibacteria bacterium]